MMYPYVFTLFIMLFVHVLVDFTLQGVLSQFKCQSYWEDKYSDEEYKLRYRNDHKISLWCHSISWSAAIIITIMGFIYKSVFSYMAEDMTTLIVIVFILNTIIHYCVDDLKANKHKINLVVDQLIHFAQIIITWLIPVLYVTFARGIISLY